MEVWTGWELRNRFSESIKSRARGSELGRVSPQGLGRVTYQGGDGNTNISRTAWCWEDTPACLKACTLVNVTTCQYEQRGCTSGRDFGVAPGPPCPERGIAVPVSPGSWRRCDTANEAGGQGRGAQPGRSVQPPAQGKPVPSLRCVPTRGRSPRVKLTPAVLATPRLPGGSPRVLHRLQELGMSRHWKRGGDRSHAEGSA